MATYGTQVGEVCNRPMSAAAWGGGALTILCNIPLYRNGFGVVTCGNGPKHAKYGGNYEGGE